MGVVFSRIIAWIWAAISITCVGVIAWLFTQYASLSPQVNSDFFFASATEAFLQHEQIGKDFPSEGAQLIIKLGTENNRSSAHLQAVQTVSHALETMPGITSVNSLTHGPKNIQAALHNPLWKRVVASPTPHASYIIAGIDEAQIGTLTQDIEALITSQDAGINAHYFSGVPYIVHMIKAYLKQDLSAFMLAATILLTCIILLLFRSVWLTFSIALTVAASAMLSMLLISWISPDSALLAGNLLTITAILTLSHLVFLTGNYRRLGAQLSTTLRQTVVASFWCMCTTILGFFSLLLVAAKPLQELGIGGVIATITAFFVTYTLYPPLLKLYRINTHKNSQLNIGFARIMQHWPIVLFVLMLGLTASSIGIPRVHTDPSLLDYFNSKSTLHQGLASIDADGGSSPLKLVVSRKDEDFLDNETAHQALLALHHALEAHPETGIVLSLPILVEEVRQDSRGKHTDLDLIHTLLKSEAFGQLGDAYVDPFAEQTVFFLRMNEANRMEERQKVIAELRTIIEAHEHQLLLVGGAYQLQSLLAQDLKSSVIQGLFSLCIIFFLLSFLITFSFSSACIITAVVSGIVVLLLGILGWLRVPLDIICAPSINVCIGIAIDSLIHITLAAKRLGGTALLEAWRKACREQGPACIQSALLVAGGFSIFALSQFPPTVRFGSIIAGGILLTACMVLVVFPALQAAHKHLQLPRT